MKIRLNITLGGATRCKRPISVEAPEGATVRQVLEAYREQYTALFDIENMRGLMVLVNNASAKSHQPVCDNDTVSIIRPLRGG